uniref:NADH-FMN oxidoreductase RutF, flavin reductase (DIM6/NTAB) family n=1 Tax=Candidatus Kentrum sp. LPFa TaxID=2126335 RepID=A0A450XEY8_9GAMM|nr:MAG: NADH-FMN oxidoreductase RutF, flavin reductase (DIM6/NTAB) family [Candidatus Kentron sp. LPFa]
MTPISSAPNSIDFTRLDHSEVNEILTRLVVPRPIGWVLTGDGKGHLNLAPFSSVAPVCNDPPLLVFSAERSGQGVRKTTANNILETQEFVMHLVDRTMLEKAIATALPGDSFPNKLLDAGVVTAPCKRIGLRRIVQCPTAFECRLFRHISVGSDDSGADIFLGRIVAVWERIGVVADTVGALEINAYLVGGARVFVPNPNDSTIDPFVAL